MSTMNELLARLQGKEFEETKKAEVVYSTRELSASKAILDNLLATRPTAIQVKTA